MIKPNPNPKLRTATALSACLLLAAISLRADTLFSAYFNNGTGSSGDKSASVYNWTSAVGSGGVLDNSLTGAPAQVGVSQGVTVGVPVVSGQSTAAGFLFARPDAAAGAMLLHSTLLVTSDAFQDTPQGNWFRNGTESLVGLTIGHITQLSVYTRAATTATRMRFAIRIGGDWYVSVASFQQGNIASFEQHSLSGLSNPNAWHTGVFTSGTFLDTDASDNPTVTLVTDDTVTGYGWYAETGAQSGDSARVRIDCFQITASTAVASSDAVVTLAGNTGTEEFKDVMELSDGTLLVAGSAENLDWISAPKAQLPPLGIPNRTTGRTAFLMRVSADTRSILGVWHLPAGQAHDFRWIKGTHKPGSPTGGLYLSGACDTTSGEYFIARLDANFITSAPGGFSWVKVAKASSAHGDNQGLQTWDVGGDGRVAYVDETGGTVRVFFLDASGQPMKLAGLRGSHWMSGATLDDVNRQTGIGADLPTTSVSGISFPGDLRSWIESDQLAILPDGNGQIKRGSWPLDLFIPVRDRDGGSTGTIEYGYTGYKSVGRHRIGGIAVNRDTNDFSIGFNIQSRFWDAAANKEQPDFEPAVISYTANGGLKWWSRLYHEVIDSNTNGQVNSGETRLSSPDQYVDGLAIDYSATPNRLVVLSRCHGNNEVNLWRGNVIAATPGANAFQNQFTGTEGNIHLSWIGKLRDNDGTLLHSSYLAGYLRDVSLTQAVYGDPVLDGWPSHNAGWPNLTTTRAEPGTPRTDAAGRVYVVGLGPRMVTTSNAWQKLPKITPSINQGISPWSQFARVMAPDLGTLAYSTALTGEWTYPEPGAQPVGADNTDLYGIFPISNGLVAVGRQRNSGNPVPSQNVPAWGSGAPSGVSALFARLPFAGGGSAGSSLPVINAVPAVTPSPVTGTSAQLATLAEDPNDPESALIYTWSTVNTPAGGAAVFSPNGTNEAKQTTCSFTRAGIYRMRVTVTNTLGRSVADDFDLTVQASATGLVLTPAVTEVATFNSFVFTAAIIDQFGQQGSADAATWSVTGGGSITPNGVFTAGSAPGGPHTVTASLNGFQESASFTVVEGNAPRIALPATSLSQLMQSGSSTSRPLRIHNLGTQTLTWSAAPVLPTGGEITTFETSAQPGGPAFGWIDISSGSTTIWAPTGNTIHDDQSAALNFSAGFVFPFYGSSFTQARVCSNGFLTFSSSTSTAYNNLSLPTLASGTPGSLIAAAWADWVVDASSWVKWKLIDPDTLVITWNNIRRFNPATERATFQCVLKSNGDIIIQVKSFAPTDRSYTVGIQNSNATRHVQAAFDPATHFIPTGTNSNFAVRFPLPAAVPGWLSLVPSSGTTAANSAGQFDVIFTSAGLALGRHQATILLSSNDPLDPLLEVPVTLSVGSAGVPPNPPLDLVAQSATTEGVANLSWSPDGGSPAGYRVDFRLMGQSSWTIGSVFGSTALQGDVSGLVPGVAHEFRVLAINGAGESAPSNIAIATPLTALEAWRYEHFNTTEDTGDAADHADPDQDAVVNLLEFALLGGDPMENSTAILPTGSLTEDNGESYLTLTVDRNPAASGIGLVVETSGSLEIWNHGPGHTVVVQNNSNTLVVRDVIPHGSAEGRFIRLKVVRH